MPATSENTEPTKPAPYVGELRVQAGLRAMEALPPSLEISASLFAQAYNIQVYLDPEGHIAPGPTDAPDVIIGGVYNAREFLQVSPDQLTVLNADGPINYGDRDKSRAVADMPLDIQNEVMMDVTWHEIAHLADHARAIAGVRLSSQPEWMELCQQLPSDVRYYYSTMMSREEFCGEVFADQVARNLGRNYLGRVGTNRLWNLPDKIAQRVDDLLNPFLEREFPGLTTKPVPSVPIAGARPLQPMKIVIPSPPAVTDTPSSTPAKPHR